MDSITQLTATYPWTTFLLILSFVLCYIGYFAYLHQHEKITFFYSYRDVSIALITPVILIILPFTVKDTELFKIISITLITVSTIWIWIITYRSNRGRFFVSLWVFIGKLLLSLIIWILLALSIGLAVAAGSGKRKKYERHSSHKKRTQAAFVGTLLGGFGLAGTLLTSCCLNEDFSSPPKHSTDNIPVTYIND